MTSVIVSNISPLLEKHHLRELFECCGKIESVEFEDNGQQRTCSITFSEPAHAKAAQFLSGTPLGDRDLTVTLKPDTPAIVPNMGVNMQQPMLGANLLLPQTFSNVPAAPMSEEQKKQQSNLQAIIQQMSTPSTPATSSLLATGIDSQGIKLSTPLLVASQKRAAEVARTIYVGNLNASVKEEHLLTFFKNVGNILYVKMAGDPSQSARYAFVEFDSQESAATALTLSGTMLGDRMIKVGKANNPIVKPASKPEDAKKLQEIMEIVRQQQAKIDNKVRGDDSDDSDYRRRKRRRRRSRSRSRSRGSRSRRRSRSRSRGRKKSSRRRRSRSRSRSRRRRRSRSRSPIKPAPRRVSKREEHSGQFWDGFQWHPAPSAVET